MVDNMARLQYAVASRASALLVARPFVWFICRLSPVHLSSRHDCIRYPCSVLLGDCLIYLSMSVKKCKFY